MTINLRPGTAARGFTLLEMIVVLAISLTMMILIVPVFQVTTKTVENVERKLAIYEAARNILDIVEAELRFAVVNERGEGFSIKSHDYTDLDKFTDPTNIAPPTARYARTSRRESDSVQYTKLQAGGFRFANNLLMLGSQAFPLAYPESFLNTPELWKCNLHSTLSYGDINRTGADQTQPTRADQLADVGKITIAMVASVHYSEYLSSGDNVNYLDAPYNDLSPGNEIKTAGSTREDAGAEFVLTGSDDLQQTRYRNFSGIRAMDLDIAFWNGATRQFVDVPDKSAIYFSPPPKAIRLSITVCDVRKRGAITLQRVVDLSVGHNHCSDAEVDLNNATDIRLNLHPAPYNKRIKLGPGTQNEATKL
jgi:prepilin-type N-terminal cleavage/methylation domain-containing protein